MWGEGSRSQPNLFLSVCIRSASGDHVLWLPGRSRWIIGRTALGRCLSRKKCFLKIGLMWLAQSLNPIGIKLLWNSFFFNLCLQSNRASVAQAVLWVAAAGLLFHPTHASQSSWGSAAGCGTRQGEKKANSLHVQKHFLHFRISWLWSLTSGQG